MNGKLVEIFYQYDLDSKKFHFFSKANLALVIKNRLSIMTGNHYYLGYVALHNIYCMLQHRKEKKMNSMSKTKLIFYFV